MKLNVKLFVLSLIGLLSLVGCYGRMQNNQTGRKLDANTFNLHGPTLLVFGAVWCKPCMSEIHSLNRAVAEFKGRVQINNFVVEGPQKGVAVDSGDKALVVSPSGERPEYQVYTDPSWDKFGLIDPSAGRSLPTMVFVNAGGEVVRIVQRSMEYETELLPALRALATGQGQVAPTPEPTPAPKDPGARTGKLATLTFADWAAAPGNEATSTLYKNVHAAWDRGLTDFNFFEDDMPFDSAKMNVFAYEDGQLLPKSAKWVAAATGCSLTVYLSDDGSYLRSVGICR